MSIEVQFWQCGSCKGKAFEVLQKDMDICVRCAYCHQGLNAPTFKFGELIFRSKDELARQQREVRVLDQFNYENKQYQILQKTLQNGEQVWILHGGE